MNHRLDTQICEPSIRHRDLGTIGDREHTDLDWTLSFITDVVHRERRIAPIPNPGSKASEKFQNLTPDSLISIPLSSTGIDAVEAAT
ncbi:hypothetical protein L6452_38636 [Arctium lappa]|uniref:Uncharacterized protein n=1 Tax=Arctium lappa TaxID=4217 RepID=A0ACB8XQ30_ARCLA|nr:hypothetical protein L6452_38636 [Arctium lappa]